MALQSLNGLRFQGYQTCLTGSLFPFGTVRHSRVCGVFIVKGMMVKGIIVKGINGLFTHICNLCLDGESAEYSYPKRVLFFPLLQP